MTRRLNKVVPASLDTRGVLFVGISLVLVGVGLLLSLFIDNQIIRAFGISLGISLTLATFGFIAGLHFVDRKTAEFVKQLEIPTVEELEMEVDEERKNRTLK